MTVLQANDIFARKERCGTLRAFLASFSDFFILKEDKQASKQASKQA